MYADATADAAMMERVRVAYTLEQCWHRVPGGTGVAALRIAEAMHEQSDIQLLGVAGRHGHLPPDPWVPPMPVAYLPVAAPWLYETWLRAQWPKVERATGHIDVAHATTLIPCATDAPLVVTLHDLAFLHDAAHFTAHGVRVFRRSVREIRRRADLVLCCSEATMDDCVASGIGADRLRLVPLGVEPTRATPADMARVRSLYRLPEQYLLFVGTVEPRKNLAGLFAAQRLLDQPLPLVVVGAEGWGDAADEILNAVASDGVADRRADVRFLGFVPHDDLPAVYACAEVFCYPSLREGFGLPILEAMAQGVPVVTSQGGATEETAGRAAVLVDPARPADIAAGIADARSRRAELAGKGIARAHQLSWSNAAALTAAAYREVAR